MINFIFFSVLLNCIVQEGIFARKISNKELKNSRCPIENCIRQFALNVVRNVKFLSNLIRIGQFTAENAGKRKDRPEGDIRL